MHDTDSGHSGRWIVWFAAGTALFHIWANTLGNISELWRNSIHLALLGGLGFLLYPGLKKKTAVKSPSLLSWVLSGLILSAGFYLVFFEQALHDRNEVPVLLDLIFAGLAVLLTLASIALPVKGIVSPNEASIPRNDVVWYLGMSAVTIVVIVITRLAQELIVRRRQSFDDLHEVQADDAMRSASIQGLAGLGYGAPMWICAAMAWDLQVTSQRPFTWILAPAMFLLMAGGLGMLLGFPRLQTRWTVPRAREA